ncbi:MAG: DUF4433 domain-containing protein [Thermoanaerobaculia bacterium]|nr:DUF4433 domain-containing protein [Thermoanaerobaculia bacterium]
MTPAAFVAMHRVSCLFHFTDERNLPFIKDAGGLLSLKELRRRGLHPPASHDADARRGLDGFVHLCLFNEHPMEYLARQEGRILSSRFLRVHPDVLLCDGIRFTPGVSNKSGMELLSLDQALERMDFSAVYDASALDGPDMVLRRRQAKKYEVLVPVMVPLRLIGGL